MKGKIPILAGALVALLVVFATAPPASADSVQDLIGQVVQGPTEPVIFEDQNWSVASQTVTINGVAREVITGFVDFQRIASSGVTVPPAEIRNAAQFNPTRDLGGLNHEMTGWFAAMLLGFGANPEGGLGTAAFFEPIPKGTVLTIGASGRTWNPSSTGTILQLWEDADDDFSSATLGGAFATGTDGTWLADVGWTTTATTTATYAGDDVYFTNIFSLGIPAPGTTPDFLFGNADILAGTGWFNLALTHDAGHTFYIEGDFEGTAGPWFVTGDADAKMLFGPLPVAAWPGLLILGAVVLHRRRRRKVEA